MDPYLDPDSLFFCPLVAIVNFAGGVQQMMEYYQNSNLELMRHIYSTNELLQLFAFLSIFDSIINMSPNLTLYKIKPGYV